MTLDQAIEAFIDRPCQETATALRDEAETYAKDGMISEAEREALLFSAAIGIAYPDSIVKADGTPFVRPAFTEDDTVFTTGFYWTNLDGDSFYFDSYAGAAADLAQDIGMDEAEAREVIAAGKAVC